MKRHPLDIVSLVFGLFFAAVGLTFLVSEDPWDLVFDSVSLGWILPFAVLAGGAALLVSALRPNARAETDSPTTRSAASAPAVESHPGAGEED
jgi:hypothetical protein